MNILTEIQRAEGINLHGKTICRTAVRGVILRGHALLMVHSANLGDYKFPGGGVQAGETHEQALHRELLEECGATLSHFGNEIGVILEYNFAQEKEYDTFKMTSHYYRGEVKDGFGSQSLDDYEQQLGFEPIWVDIDQAIERNRSLLNSTEPPDWLKREIFALEYIRQKIKPAP